MQQNSLLRLSANLVLVLDGDCCCSKPLLKMMPCCSDMCFKSQNFTLRGNRYGIYECTDRKHSASCCTMRILVLRCVGGHHASCIVKTSYDLIFALSNNAYLNRNSDIFSFCLCATCIPNITPRLTSSVYCT